MEGPPPRSCEAIEANIGLTQKVGCAAFAAAELVFPWGPWGLSGRGVECVVTHSTWCRFPYLCKPAARRDHRGEYLRLVGDDQVVKVDSLTALRTKERT